MCCLTSSTSALFLVTQKETDIWQSTHYLTLSPPRILRERMVAGGMRNQRRRR